MIACIASSVTPVNLLLSNAATVSSSLCNLDLYLLISDSDAPSILISFTVSAGEAVDK